MGKMSVEQFAGDLGVLPAMLLEQLQAAGVNKDMTADSLTEQDKSQLLDYLRQIHGAKEEKGRSSPRRRQSLEIKKSDSTGTPDGIQIKVKVSKKRLGGTRRFSGIIATQVAALRLEEAFTVTSAEDGRCAGCSQTAPRKMANTNHGTLALCEGCVCKAMRRYKKLAASKHSLPKKKTNRARRKSFVQVLQGGAPGLGKRSS